MTVPVGAALARHRRKVVAATVFAVAYCAAVEVWMPRMDVPSGRPELVVALSSGLRDDGEVSAIGAARLRTAIAVARAERSMLITTRVRHPDNALLLSDGSQRRIIDSAWGDARWVTLDGIAINTRDEATRLRTAFTPMRIAVVTSRLHTRRACATFEQAGFIVTCVSSGVETPLWYAPYFVLYESAALIKYRLQGWI